MTYIPVDPENPSKGMMDNLMPLMSSQRHSWETPDEILELVAQLGTIGLDPCTSSENPCGADEFLSHNGLEHDWRAENKTLGLVYVNPPYGRHVGDWVTKCIHESLRDLEIVLLTTARPDTDWYDRARRNCHGWCEIKGRLTFKGAKDPAPFPSAVHYWGFRPHLFAHVFSVLGRVGVRS
jgi:hypothetical protein